MAAHRSPGRPLASASTPSTLRRALNHPLLGWRKVATAISGLLAASMAYHVVFGQNGLTSFQHKRQETRELAIEQQRLLHENEFFRGHVNRLQSDPDAIEHQAREELHYTRPGEVIYTLPPAPKPVSEPNTGAR